MAPYYAGFEAASPALLARQCGWTSCRWHLGSGFAVVSPSEACLMLPLAQLKYAITSATRDEVHAIDQW